MRRWLVTFTDAPEMVRIRADKSRRAAHIAYVHAHPELDIGGDLAMSPKQDFPGAIWTIQAGNREEVRRLISADPYYIPSLRQFRITALKGDLQFASG
ncbi:MAG: hypothetical protein ACU0BB_01440 [Paracoccaceae bacterium]